MPEFGKELINWYSFCDTLETIDFDISGELDSQYGVIASQV